jgi:hypothetical protein
LPFDAIATKPDPAQKCGNCGVVSSDPKATTASMDSKVLQSSAKNDFCADQSAVTDVDFAALRQMQATANQKGWIVTDLASRDALHGFYKLKGQSIGEGSVVRLKAWVLDAHVSDCASGESVNCETPGFANNDIHIPLLDPSGDRNQDECSSVTAEMSPHFRPAAWSSVDLETPVKNVVRVTGPLFFDNAHRACAGLAKTAKDAAPFRSSLWEVHPVYQFEVCANADASKCDVSSSEKTVWIPYDQWVKSHSGSGDPAVEATGKKVRNETACLKPAHPGAGGKPAQCPTNGHARNGKGKTPVQAQAALP